MQSQNSPFFLSLIGDCGLNCEIFDFTAIFIAIQNIHTIKSIQLQHFIFANTFLFYSIDSQLVTFDLYINNCNFARELFVGQVSTSNVTRTAKY